MNEMNINQNPNDSSIPVNLKENISERREEANKNDLYTEDLNRTNKVQRNNEDFSLDNLGTIENARKHRSATSPLHKLNEFNEFVNFC